MPPSPSGGRQPAHRDPVLDVAVAFNNLELTTFTPTPAPGRRLCHRQGAASMKLNYKLQGNRLEGTNDITIKKLQLGEKVKSEQARICPRPRHRPAERFERRHQMNLKVKGNLDQPDFSLGNIFWDVLGNTSARPSPPLLLLASLTGHKDLDELPFLPGDPAPDPDPADQADHPRAGPQGRGPSQHEHSRHGQLQRRAPHPPAPEASGCWPRPPAARCI